MGELITKYQAITIKIRKIFQIPLHTHYASLLRRRIKSVSLSVAEETFEINFIKKLKKNLSLLTKAQVT